MFKINPKIIKISPKMLTFRPIDPKISKKGISYCKKPTHNKKHGTYPQNPTASPQTYLAPRAQVPQQFPALQVTTVSNLNPSCIELKLS